MTSLDSALCLVVAWFVLGAAGLAVLRDTRRVARRLFPLGALIGIAIGIVALRSMAQAPASVTLLIGLPGLPMHLRLDALSAFFLAVIGLGGAGVSIFCAGYFRAGEGTAPGLMCLFYHVFLGAMAMLMLADDAFSFLVMWELMSVSSYFLVISDHRLASVRQAGFLYLLIAHLGGLCIFAGFAVLQSHCGSFVFDDLRACQFDPSVASLAFALVLAGFGAKAGLIPLHVWLPEAHPAAPSPVSALMSAVMLKTAVYGLLRVALDLLHGGSASWGLTLLGFGLASAVFGVVFSTVQTDMKRLLAYSSIENLGLIITGLGLTLIFRAHHLTLLAALSLCASLVLVLAHAMFKNLLFLGTGVVLHATGERNLGRLGGLIRRMPWVATLVLVGILAGSGLPPTLSFIGEWMLLQGFLFTTVLPDMLLKMIVPLVAAAVALVVALAGYTMVKFYGVVFLGLPREEKLREAHDASPWERLGLAWFAGGVLVTGLFPLSVITLAEPVSVQLLGTGVADTVRNNGWLVLAPIAQERASFAPLLFLGGLIFGALLGLAIGRAVRRADVRRAPVWACGLDGVSARMQDSAEGFGQPIRQIFEPFFRLSRQIPAPADPEPRYHVTVEDRFWSGMYLPIGAAVDVLSALVGRLQRGRISIYLLYSFVTLLVLLWVVKS